MSYKDGPRCTRFAMIIMAMISSVVSTVRGNEFEKLSFPLTTEEPATSTSIASTTATRTPLPPTTPVPFPETRFQNGECPRPSEGMQWELMGNIVQKNEKHYDLEGQEVAMSYDGTIAVMGAPWRSPGYVHTAVVDIFKYNGVDWIEEASFSGGDWSIFGGGVALSGDGTTIAIGAPGWDLDIGLVEVYQKTEDGTWKPKGSKLIGLEHFAFGYSVSLSKNGNQLAVGSGWSILIRVYQFDGNDWIQLGDAIAGIAVSLSEDGNIVAVGDSAPYSDEYSGSVRIFRYNNKRRATTNTEPLRNMQTSQQKGQWIQIGQTLVGQAPGDYFGGSLSINANGDTIAIGTATWEGYVKVFHFKDEEWKQLGDTLTGENYFGYSVSIAAKAQTLAVGQYDNYERGYVKLYDFDGQSWKQIGDFKASTSEQYFGTSVSLSSCGDTVAIDLIYGDGTKAHGRMKIYELK